MYSEFEIHCTNDLFLVLAEVRNLITVDSTDRYFYSLVNIVKQLDDHSSIQKKVEQISTYELSKVNCVADNKKFQMVCRMLLGVDHEFVKSIEGVASSVLTDMENLYSLITNTIQMHSLCSIWSFSLTPNVLGFTIEYANCMSARVDGDTLEWDIDPKYTKMIALSTYMKQGSYQIFIVSRLQLPDTVMSQIKSCTNWGQLFILRRLCVTYRIPYLRQPCHLCCIDGRNHQWDFSSPLNQIKTTAALASISESVYYSI